MIFLESYGISDIGLVRKNNEDVWAEIPRINFFIIADGMGGHKAGEIAAKETVSKLCSFLESNLSGALTLEEVVHCLKRAISSANAWVYELSQHHEQCRGMGTTLCCFLLWGDTLIYAHVGDSRIYSFKEHLEQLTTDHSLRHELIASGKLSDESSFPFKNVITRAIGTSPYVSADIESRKIQSGDLFFLCSDGLTDSVTDQEITSILKQAPSVKIACESLINKAKKNGGNDNITVVMVKIIIQYHR